MKSCEPSAQHTKNFLHFQSEYLECFYSAGYERTPWIATVGDSRSNYCMCLAFLLIRNCKGSQALSLDYRFLRKLHNRSSKNLHLWVWYQFYRFRIRVRKSHYWRFDVPIRLANFCRLAEQTSKRLDWRIPGLFWFASAKYFPFLLRSERLSLEGFQNFTGSFCASMMLLFRFHLSLTELSLVLLQSFSVSYQFWMTLFLLSPPKL